MTFPPSPQEIDSWNAEVAEEDGGGGGSQNLAQVLAVGGDPDGNPITGNLQIEFGTFEAVAPEALGNGEAFIDVGDFDGDYEFVGRKGDGFEFWTAGEKTVLIGPTGAVTISPSDPVGINAALTIQGSGDPAEGSDLFDAVTADGGGFFVTADGVFGTTPSPAANKIMRLRDGTSFQDVFVVGPSGAVTISPSDDEDFVLTATTRDAGTGVIVAGEGNVSVPTFQVFGSFNNVSQPLVKIWDTGGDNAVFDVGPKGAVTISPSDDEASPLIVQRGDSSYALVIDAQNSTLRGGAAGGVVDINAGVVSVTAGPGSAGAVVACDLGAGFTVVESGGGVAIGFYSSSPQAQPTGVAVDAAAIHAALVSLGLIAA